MAAAKKALSNVSSSNKASSQKASRSKSSSSTHKAKTKATKKSSHSAKKSSGGGLFDQFLGGCSKKWKEAKSAAKKAYKKVCTTAKRVKKGFDDAKKTVGKALKTVKEKTVSAVKTISKKVSDFKKKHPILTGVAIIVVAGALTIATGGAGAGLLGAACAGAFTGSVIGAGAGAAFGFVGGLISGQGIKGALNSAAQGFGSGAASGAVSGAFSGVAGFAATTDKVSSLVKVLRSNTGQSATNTLGEIAGSITDRAINGEKITAEDVAFDLVLNSSFKAGPKVLNKLKNSKPVQTVEYGLSKLKSKVPEVNSKIISAAKSKASVAKDKFISGASNAKTKVASTVSGLKESVGNKLSGAGKKAVSAENATVKSETELPLKLNLQFFASKGGSGSIEYGELDSLGRTTGVEAIITSDMIGTGSPAKSSIKPAGFGGQVQGHARGHLLGNQLGGSGADPRNLMTIYQNPVNHPVMSSVEANVRKAVEGGQVVNYKVTPIYNGDNLIPAGITIQASGNEGLNIYQTLLNRK